MAGQWCFYTASAPRRPTWAETARDLAADFRVVLVDLPGYGDSFTEAPISYDYERMTARLLAVLRAAGALHGAVLVGHSTGGALAWHLERSGECRPAGLVLIDAVTVAFKLPFKPAVGFGLVEAYGAAGPLFNLIGNRTIQGLIARGSAGRWSRPVPKSGDETEPIFTTPARLRVNGLWARQMLDQSGRARLGALAEADRRPRLCSSGASKTASCPPRSCPGPSRPSPDRGAK